MIHFEWPWLFFALPLPLLTRWLLPRAKASTEAALRVPGLDAFTLKSAAPAIRQLPKRSRLWLAALAWLLLVTAAARPVWLGDPIDLPVSGRDLMLAVDLSGSMQTPDFVINDQQVNRLTAIKYIAGQFIDQRVGDRLGLILFGSQAYLQTPLTFDRNTVHQMLDEAAIGLAGEQTAIGDAIGLAVKRLRNQPPGNRVLILLTDGVSNAGELSPIKAAQLAAKAGVTIYTIGIGADSMQVPSLFGMQTVNLNGDLDEATLRAIANTTGGRYFRARDTAELNQIYGVIDKLQPVDQQTQTFRPRTMLFYWPLAASLLLAALIVLPVTRRRSA
jgi:Ca-activated chloride channel family protein